MKTATPEQLKRMESLVWILIYGGLFGIVLGLASRDADAAVASVLMIAGALATVVGVVLIFVRARRVEAARAPGAQSDA